MPFIERKEKVIFLTAYKGDMISLLKSIKINLQEIDKEDIWIIVLDNLSNLDLSKASLDKKIKIINYYGPPGAGNARNFGLDFVQSLDYKEFLLWPIDGDDYLKKGSRNLIDLKFRNSQFSIISFGIVEIYKHRKIEASFNGQKTFENLLERYSTPCGSTIIRVIDSNILSVLRFGKRKRGNDQLFFLSAVRHFKKCLFFEDVILEVYKTNKNSLSAKKWKQPYYKFLALKDLGLNNLSAFYYLIKYINHHIKRILESLPQIKKGYYSYREKSKKK